MVLFVGYYAAYKAMGPLLTVYLRIEGGQEPVLHALWGMQYYIAGIMIFLVSKEHSLRRILGLIVVVLTVAALIQYGGHINWEGQLIQYGYLAGIVLLATFIRKDLPFVALIGRNTMGIYLVHTPIILKGVSLMLNGVIVAPLFSFAAVLLCDLAVSVGIVAVVESVPYGCLLFGRPYQHIGQRSR